MKFKGLHILIVDDEAHQRAILSSFLEDHGAKITQAENGRDALAKFQAEPAIEVVVSDLQMPEMDGLALLKAVRAQREDVSFLMMTAHGSIETAIEAMKIGAADYLLKPLELEEVRIRIQKINETRSLARKAAWLESENKRLGKTSSVVYESPVMKKLFSDIARVIEADTTVLLTGETGVGKEVIAKYLHENGPRAKGPYMAVNCSAVPENLLESQFFGHEKGAFTGADRRVVGTFELADGGTLFLDEIGEMDLKLQAKILRALEERKITRVGAATSVSVDIRVIAATNKNLSELVKAKLFREDLYYRLNVVHFQIPALRERREDLQALVRTFVERDVGAKKKSQLKVEPSFIEALMKYPFPGNVRELKNIIERAVLFANSQTLTAASLPAELTGGAQPVASVTPIARWTGAESLGEIVGAYEKSVIETAINECGGDVEDAAKKLKVSRSALYAKIQKYGAAS